ncbi:NAD-P-binding protein [Auriscalpium vulgare]|uniref:NAD-P-binding protein n=1 Tax=Auriscalpium vulgare TaxID=40419 RepID=A0ACB8RBQ5_9AGAM|nr:NAD-P-binding protein [Auriscalpium vulgare]
MSSPKIWLITGSNSGLGLSLASYVLSKGDKVCHTVIAAARDVAKIPPSLSGAHPIELNPSAPETEVYAAANEALQVYGRIDVLVNNAAYSLTGPVEELDPVELRAEFQTNLFGPIALIKALLPSFRAQRSGHILNISSIAGFAGEPSLGAYNASKAALDAFSDSLSREVAPFAIRVLTIMPGFFPTTFFTRAASTRVPEGRRLSEYATAEQGGLGIDWIYPAHVRDGQVGDGRKAAQRMWEIVWGEGLARGLVEGQGGKREWVRVPLGPDSVKRMRVKLAQLAENVDAMEPIWSSTDMDEEQIRALREQLDSKRE